VPCGVVSRRPTSQKIWGGAGQGMTEFIQTVKIETRLPVEGSFGKDHLEINFR